MITRNRGVAGGGIECARKSYIAGNVIAYNRSLNRGGGILITAESQNDSVVVNNTIVGKRAGTGGAIMFYGALPDTQGPMLANNIIAFNASGWVRATDYKGVPQFRNNCIFGNGTEAFRNIADPAGFGGNIAVEPQLANWPAGDSHLVATSPCVNAGDSSFLTNVWYDLDDEPRSWVRAWTSAPMSFRPRTTVPRKRLWQGVRRLGGFISPCRLFRA